MADGTSSETKTSGIWKALHAVMSEIGHIGKDRVNPQQGYKFRGIDDVLEKVQPLFIKHGVLCFPEVLNEEREILPTKNGGSMVSVRLKVKFTYEASDGSTRIAITYGEAMDSGDKAGNKAHSVALKNAHFEVFSIPVNAPDRDTEEHSPEIGSRAPQGPTPRPADKPASSPQRSPGTPRPAPKPDNGAVFPNYGRSKGQSIAGAPVAELQFYANGCRRSLADSSKSRFHDKERALLEAIEAEIFRQGNARGDVTADGPPPHTDDDAQPF